MLKLKNNNFCKIKEFCNLKIIFIKEIDKIDNQPFFFFFFLPLPFLPLPFPLPYNFFTKSIWLNDSPFLDSSTNFSDYCLVHL